MDTRCPRPPQPIPGPAIASPDRRTRRREQTRSEILDHALQIMAEDGVAGLSMARLARAMDIRPPSLYKYYPSLLAIYDALFRRGQRANLEALRDGMRDAAPGLEAVARGMEATGRWAVANPALAQLLFWRPVPGYQPSAEAFAPARQIIDLLRSALADAACRGQVHPDAATDAAWNCCRSCTSGSSASTWPTTPTATGTMAGTPAATGKSSPCSSRPIRPGHHRRQRDRHRTLLAASEPIVRMPPLERDLRCRLTLSQRQEGAWSHE